MPDDWIEQWLQVGEMEKGKGDGVMEKYRVLLKRRTEMKMLMMTTKSFEAEESDEGIEMGQRKKWRKEALRQLDSLEDDLFSS